MVYIVVENNLSSNDCNVDNHKQVVEVVGATFVVVVTVVVAVGLSVGSLWES